MSATRRLTAPVISSLVLVALAAMLLSFPSFGSSPTAAPAPVAMAPEPSPVGVRAAVDTAIFAGGCFWGVEAVFEHLAGVSSASSGYAGGKTQSPTYRQVSSGETGHAEAVLVVYDPAKISYDQLLQIFFTVAHDPTQLNRQGPDVGTQYRSAVFYRNEAQRSATERYIAKAQDAKLYPGKIVTQVAPLEKFYEAEGYHQNYLVRHPDQPYIVYNDLPKLEHLKREFPSLYRDPGVS